MSTHAKRTSHNFRRTALTETLNTKTTCKRSFRRSNDDDYHYYSICVAQQQQQQHAPNKKTNGNKKCKTRVAKASPHPVAHSPAGVRNFRSSPALNFAGFLGFLVVYRSTDVFMLRRPAGGGADARQRVAGNWLRHKAVQQIRGGVWAALVVEESAFSF